LSYRLTISINVCFDSSTIVQTSFCSPEKLVSKDLVSSYSHGLTFTARRQHVNIATTLVISGSTTDSLKLCQIAMIISAWQHTACRARYMSSPVSLSVSLSDARTIVSVKIGWILSATGYSLHVASLSTY